MKTYYIYILSSNTTTLYVGVTGDLERRMYEYKFGLVEGFTKRYNIHRLVYYEEFEYIDDAIEREKQIKKWRREKKLDLVRTTNPEFVDLAEDWFEEGR